MKNFYSAIGFMLDNVNKNNIINNSLDLKIQEEKFKRKQEVLKEEKENKRYLVKNLLKKA